MLRFARRVPAVYSVDHRKPIFLPTTQALNAYTESLSKVLVFAIKELGIRKLTILAVGEATQIVLALLARMALNMFEYIDKVILINCQYGRFRFAHSLSVRWYADLLIQLSLPQRLGHLNRLRLVSIQTHKANRLQKAENYHLVFPNGKYLRNYVAVESRHMWNTYLDFQEFEVLDFDSFLNLVAQFLVLDSGSTLPVKSIQYFFLYKEEPHPEPRAAYKQQFTLHCMESLLELQVPRQFFEDKRCKHLKFRGSETNHSLIIEGPTGLEIFTEKYLKIHPISNASRVVYYLHTTRLLAGIYIFNPTSHPYLLSVVKSQHLEWQEVDSSTLQQVLTSSKVMHFPDVATKVCPEKPLVFPAFAGTKCFNLRSTFIIQPARSNSLVLFDIENPYIEHFLCLHRNLVLASLAGLQLTEQTTLGLLPYQLAINALVLSEYSLLFVLLETLYTLSLATALLKLLGLLRWLARVFSLEFDKDFVFVLSPFVFILKQFTSVAFPLNEWYGASIAMLSIMSKKGSIVCWALFYLNFDYILRSESALLRFILMELSLLVAVFADNAPQLGSGYQLLNTGLLALLHLFSQEEAAWVQFILEAYVLAMAAVLLVAFLRGKARPDGDQVQATPIDRSK